MELNHVLLFTAVGSSLLIILQTIRDRARPLQFGAAAVLLVAAMAWVLVRPIAGWVAAAVWCALIVLPAYRQRRARGSAHGNHRRAVDFKSSPAVLLLAITNIAVFLLEVFSGGPTNALTLDRLGWLDTGAVIYSHQYWRVLTALFLHYGVLHLFFNVFALVILGPGLERQIGSVLFALCYLISGVVSSVIIVLLTKLQLLAPVELVGASGSVMGIVGTWAGFLLRNRNAPLATERLRSIVLIVLLQTAFDLVTPRVSMSAHIGGLSTGLLLGICLPSRYNPRHVIRSR